MSGSKRKYRFVGHVPDELEGGRPVHPDEVVEIVVDKEHPRNQSLVADGKLVALTSGARRASATVIANTTNNDNDEKEETS